MVTLQRWFEMVTLQRWFEVAPPKGPAHDAGAGCDTLPRDGARGQRRGAPAGLEAAHALLDGPRVVHLKGPCRCALLSLGIEVLEVRACDVELVFLSVVDNFYPISLPWPDALNVLFGF